MKRYERYVECQTEPPLQETAVDLLGLEASELMPLLASGQRVGIWRVDLGADTVHWCDTAYAMHGLEPGEEPLSLDQAISSYYPADALKLARLIKEALETAAPFRYVLRVLRPDRPMRLIEARARVTCNISGRPVELYGTFADVTAEADHNNLMRGQANLIRSMLKHVPMAVAICDKQMRYLTCSDPWLELHGIAPTTHVQGKPLDAPIDGAVPQWKAFFHRALGGEHVRQDNEAIRRSDGRTDTIDMTMQPWFLSPGAPGGVILIAERVTEEMAREKERWQAVTERNALRAAFEEMRVGVLVGEASGKPLLYANAAARKLFALGDDGDDAEALSLTTLLTRLSAPEGKDQVFRTLVETGRVDGEEAGLVIDETASRELRVHGAMIGAAPRKSAVVFIGDAEDTAVSLLKDLPAEAGGWARGMGQMLAGLRHPAS